MKNHAVDIVIIGAGPVGLMSAYLAQMCGLTTVIIDKSHQPLEVGRADALNARTLQLLQIAALFDELYPLGKKCNTSSVWKDGKFISRQSTWWDEIEGCFHKHFLMLGQAYVERLLDKKLNEMSHPVRRSTHVDNIDILEEGCITTLSSGEKIQSRYIIGADGSHSFVRHRFHIPFQIECPEMTWAVIDGVIDTDFQKVPEIIVFQSDTSDVAWIPREGDIDRFYVRMDKTDFTLDEAIKKINVAMSPHTMRLNKIVWFSQFSVKEAVAEKFFVHDRVFLAGDACHIHSVNGGQGLNTGLADAFNLIWKLNMVINFNASAELLQSYEKERQAVARGVIETSGALVRATKYSEQGTHAEDYIKIVQKRSGYITGMGIRYSDEGLVGSRLYDVEVFYNGEKTRIYSLLDYTKFTLFIFGDYNENLILPNYINVVRLSSANTLYADQAILVRPDSYIALSLPLSSMVAPVMLLGRDGIISCHMSAPL